MDSSGIRATVPGGGVGTFYTIEAAARGLAESGPLKISKAHVIQINETDELKQATENWQKEVQAYAQSNPDLLDQGHSFDPEQVYAQVLIEGKVAASINKDGSVQTSYDLSGVDLPKGGGNAAQIATEKVSEFFAYISETIYSDFQTPLAVSTHATVSQPQSLVDAENRLERVVEQLLMQTLRLSGRAEDDPVHLSKQAISNYTTYHQISHYQQMAGLVT